MKPIAWYDPTNGAVSTDKDSPLFTPLGQVLPLYTKVEQEPVAWKLMPRDATDAMLKAMDECSTEGYDERLYAGHAASVYMAAWDASDTHPPQRTWVGLMRGVRVEGNAVVITVKGGNDEARALCGELINEMEKNT